MAGAQKISMDAGLAAAWSLGGIFTLKVENYSAEGFSKRTPLFRLSPDRLRQEFSETRQCLAAGKAIVTCG